ncbi:RluA family pseudouridine synthase [Erysipelothrix rhusiopathiae]|uniref:RluA family pseudouridine synthase n=1 Tax=Erysipelothrix rhusiopathiae TaxID=1648 RepID=UPI001EE04999|nr:RluA family pseudouridine synthase [Erysipelothrix rhusiopathiae]MCG4456826.1 RluA family pseudouridine synthase [Erysipelothrix rhusiopathiae]MDE8072931.1 RluA family pseudouridine synthase [Erysipelothrix rhusiopathiae]MDE8074338.1 RluA family pseudouridine synthase [Erysipelothrix rhusiopathiae]MDE8103472.1 RluA family pseudouridine synthase [Erysipelothrix rhusiopathiae]MDE8124100.1 RluA family pseudouridine synthase [Erysipelothrix rhusiopathiae]
MGSWIITSKTLGLRIDHFLNEHLDLSRSKIASMIKDGTILCNDMPTKANYKTKLNDCITASTYQIKTLDIEPVKMDIDVVYEDEYLLVVNKPRGLVVHPGNGVKSDTLLHGLLYYLNSNCDHYIRPGLVHRIDRNTSGLLVIAKDDKTHQFLAEQLLDKTMNRTYYALVHGVLPQAHVLIDAPIGPDKSNTKIMTVNQARSKPARTHFEKIETYINSSLIRCKLETGRTHQIRVHALHANIPLHGDPQYGHPSDTDKTGQYLCAARLEFVHPKYLKLMQFEIPLPSYFQDKITELSHS